MENSTVITPHKQDRTLYMQEYKQKNKEALAEKNRIYHNDYYNKKLKTKKYTCICGSTVLTNSRHMHNKTAKHTTYHSLIAQFGKITV